MRREIIEVWQLKIVSFNLQFLSLMPLQSLVHAYGKFSSFKRVLEFGIPATTEGVELTEAQQKSITDQKLTDLKVKNYLFQAID